MSEETRQGAKSLIAVARALRTRGLKGELVADLLTDFPERFAGLSELLAVSPGGDIKPVQLESHWFQKGRIVLKFADYDSIESASALIGYEFAVPETKRVELAEGEYYNWELEGCRVETVEGRIIGKVREVMMTGGVAVLVVEDDTKHDYLIPFSQSIVVDIDIPRKTLRVDPPEGLLEL
jgi:16S rRNA processing protein RimM